MRRRSFEWRARVGLGPLAPLEVVDRCANGVGSVTGRLLGRYELFHQADEDVRRSAAGRAALEAILAPASLLPGRGVSWRAEDDEHIVASSYLEPEQVDVHMQIDSRGPQRKTLGDSGKHSHGYLTFGGDTQAERRFGDLVIPSQLTVGWRYGSSKDKPFFHARIRALQPHNHQPRRPFCHSDAGVNRTDERLLDSSHRGSGQGAGAESQLRIPLENVVSAQAAHELAHEWFHGMRVGVTHIPGVISAGRFYLLGENVFWDVHEPDRAIAIGRRDERYAKLVIEVENPERNIIRVGEAIAAAQTPVASG